MRDFMETIYAQLFLGYMLYALTFLYCLIPMLIQIVFSYFVENKQIWKVAIMVFCTQGIIVPIAQCNHDMIYSIYHDSKALGFWNVVNSTDFKFNFLRSLILFTLIIGIGFFAYRGIEGKLNYKKWISLTGGYLINIAIMVFMMLKFGLIVTAF